MKKIKYTKPTIKCVKMKEDIMLTITSSETIGSHEGGGGSVLSKPHSLFDEDSSEGSSSRIWGE